MEKKTIYYIIGGVAVLGIGYYFWNKSKSDKSKETGETTPVSSESSNEESVTKEKEVTTSSDDTKKPILKPLNIKPVIGKDGIKNIATAVAKLKPISSQELESKLQSACGKKPLLKKNKVKYEQCRENYKNKLKNEGFSFFAGNTESVFTEDFYSSFESNLDLDI